MLVDEQTTAPHARDGPRRVTSEPQPRAALFLNEPRLRPPFGHGSVVSYYFFPIFFPIFWSREWRMDPAIRTRFWVHRIQRSRNRDPTLMLARSEESCPSLLAFRDSRHKVSTDIATVL
jgi:hypothetical protein